MCSEPQLRESPTGSQLLGVVEDLESRLYGVGVWSRDGQLQHRVSLPTGWTPKDQWADAGPPAAVRFTREGRIRMRLPWSGGVEFDVGLAESLVVPGPER